MITVGCRSTTALIVFTVTITVVAAVAVVVAFTDAVLFPMLFLPFIVVVIDFAAIVEVL